MRTQSLFSFQSVNASMPYLTVSYSTLYKFLKLQQENYKFYDQVWIQNLNKINKCTAFVYQSIEEHKCDHSYPFVCEMGKYEN